MLYEDQRDVCAYIMKHLQKWVQYADSYNESSSEPFHPLRLTVKGLAGSGKTVLINTVITVIREMFGVNDSVQVCAPTGSAASNIRGSTIHNLLEVPV